MAVEIEAPTQVSCPPHYWLIERLDLHHQHWTCQRCGAVQEYLDQRRNHRSARGRSGTVLKAGSDALSSNCDFYASTLGLLI